MILFLGKKKGQGFSPTLFLLQLCSCYLETIFLKTLIPVVTTIIAPTIGRAVGNTSPMIPMILDATLVKLVVNAVTTPSICLPPSSFFVLYTLLNILINPCIATPIAIGIQPMTKPIGIDVTNNCPTSSRDSVSIVNASISIYSPSFNYGNTLRRYYMQGCQILKLSRSWTLAEYLSLCPNADLCSGLPVLVCLYRSCLKYLL